MIALVSGTVAVRRGDHVVVDCGGVGYRLSVSAGVIQVTEIAERKHLNPGSEMRREFVERTAQLSRATHGATLKSGSPVRAAGSMR